MIKKLIVMYIGFATSFCLGDVAVESEVVIAPKGVNAAANIGSVNSSVNVRMDLAKVDIHIAKPGDSEDAPIALDVKATFELINESSHDLNLTVGFPISNSGYSSFELSQFGVVTNGIVREVFRRIGRYPHSTYHKYVSGNKADRNATPPPEEIGSDSLFGYQSMGQDSFQNLMVWEETFTTSQRKKIEVAYQIDIPLQENKVVRKRVFSNSKGISSEAANNIPLTFLITIDTGSYYFFDYYLTSGASWAGTIGFEKVTLHFDHWWKRNLDFSSTIKEGEIIWYNQTDDKTLPMTATYQFRDKEPTENIYFAIRPDKQTNGKDEKAKDKLAEGQALWKNGALDIALLYLEEAVRIDPSNEQTAKVLKSMELQKQKIDELLNRVDEFLNRSNYKDAKRSLEKASMINDQYGRYKKVLQVLQEMGEI